MSNRLPLDATNTDDRLVFAYTEDAIKLAIGKDIKANISERADKSYSTQVYYCMDLGAVRMEEKAIFQKEYDQEKDKLEKAVKLDVISVAEKEQKLAKARLKLDNFDTIRKVKKQYEMSLISKDELNEKLAALGV